MSNQKSKRFDLLDKFNDTSRYLDDIFTIDKPAFAEAKSRKYQGVFEVKSRVKTWQVRGIWSQQLEH